MHPATAGSHVPRPPHPDRVGRPPGAWTRAARLGCLILAGEAIFSLPFHVPRFFRASLLAETGLGNAALGDIFAIYGLTAMLAYFPGGALADRVAARTLLWVSLLATAAGGLYLARTPTVDGLRLLYGYWGVTTILLFWAALIRATREWGGAAAQGRAFGALDAGRGLVAAVLATAAVALLTGAAAADSGAALTRVIYFYTAITAVAALLCRLVLPADHPAGSSPRHWSPDRFRAVLGAPTIWLQAAIVVTAYCGYKGLDYYALYLQAAWALDPAAAAWWFSLTAYLRPLAAIAAGLCADRIGIGRMVAALFVAGAAGYLGLGATHAPPLAWLAANLVLTLCAVYGLRGVYFALLQETRVAPALSGTAVGIISVVGYTPDVFFAPLAGRLLDATPGTAGFRHVFLLLALIFVAGLLATLVLRRCVRSHPGASEPARSA